MISPIIRAAASPPSKAATGWRMDAKKKKANEIKSTTDFSAILNNRNQSESRASHRQLASFPDPLSLPERISCPGCDVVGDPTRLNSSFPRNHQNLEVRVASSASENRFETADWFYCGRGR